mgnify:CR=1 FL=1
MFSDLRAHSLPQRRLHTGLLPAVVAAVGLSGPLVLGASPASAQQAGYGQTLGTSPMERQIYDGGSGRPSGGSILDSTNPLDLMNKIRRGTAMDDATPPASAIDQALQQFESQGGALPGATTPAAAASATAGGVSGSPSRPLAQTPAQIPAATP